jgi:hypothetical protein
MIDNLIRDFQVLHKADVLIARIWLNVTARRLGLFAFAGLIAVFGLGMANVAGFYALQASAGAVWGAAIVAAVDFALASIVALVAKTSAPGPEMQLASEVRKMAVDSIEADAGEVRQVIDALGQDLREAKETVLGFARNPLDVAAQKILVPAAISIIRGIRSRKESPRERA